MKKILSIDGGGIRGIIPGQILVHLERLLQEKSGDPEARLGEYFDFMAGTSTGGILICLLLAPSSKDNRKPRYSARQAVDLYLKHGEKVFDLDIWQIITSGKGVLDEKYNEKALVKLLDQYFKKERLSDLIKPCIITAYDIERRKTHFFAQQDRARKGKGGDFYVKDVCRATSAAPTFFEAALVKSLSGVSYALVDGGVFANNPTLCAYSEVRNASGRPKAKDMFIVSLGTGSEHTRYPYKAAKNWGSISWIRPLIDIMMSGASESTNYHLEMMYNAVDAPENYIRIQPSDMLHAELAMDNATPENIAALQEVGIETAEKYASELEKIVDQLLLGPDPVEFT